MKFQAGDLIAFVEERGRCLGVVKEVAIDYYVRRIDQSPSTGRFFGVEQRAAWYVEAALERAVWTFVGPVVPAWRSLEMRGQEWLVEKLRDKYEGTGEFTDRRQREWNKLVEMRRAVASPLRKEP
jgi:hypothetical protein